MKSFFHLSFNEILNEKQISWLISVTFSEQQGILYKRETLLVWWGTLWHVFPTVQPYYVYFDL